MATKAKAPTPPLISMASYTGFLNQLRELGTIPTRIDKTLMPKASGSQIAAMLAALKYLGHIDESLKPSEEFKALIMMNEGERKPIFAKLIRDRFDFLFNDPNFDLEAATSGEMAEKFRALDIQGSTVIKTISFFLALAKEAGLKVSPHIKPPSAPKGTGASKKAAAKKEEEGGNGNANSPEEKHDGVQQFLIPIPGKRSVRVVVPEDLDGDDWEMLQTVFTVYVKRWKGFSNKEDK